jgi:hypothetical protein
MHCLPARSRRARGGAERQRRQQGAARVSSWQARQSRTNLDHGAHLLALLAALLRLAPAAQARGRQCEPCSCQPLPQPCMRRLLVIADDGDTRQRLLLVLLGGHGSLLEQQQAPLGRAGGRISSTALWGALREGEGQCCFTSTLLLVEKGQDERQGPKVAPSPKPHSKFRALFRLSLPCS